MRRTRADAIFECGHFCLGGEVVTTCDDLRREPFEEKAAGRPGSGELGRFVQIRPCSDERIDEYSRNIPVSFLYTLGRRSKRPSSSCIVLRGGYFASTLSALVANIVPPPVINKWPLPQSSRGHSPRS